MRAQSTQTPLTYTARRGHDGGLHERNTPASIRSAPACPNVTDELPVSLRSPQAAPACGRRVLLACSTIALPPPRRTGSTAASTRPSASSLSRRRRRSHWSSRTGDRTAPQAPAPAVSRRTRARPRWPSWLARGAAMACGSVAPRSSRSRRICSTTVMMVEPPGETSASSGWPSSSTIVGLIELRGRLPPSTRFGWVNESKLKSVSSLLSRNPRPAPRRRCRRSTRS
jgi:hypothetical protein